jgi:choline-glycine betaine transporter
MRLFQKAGFDFAIEKVLFFYILRRKIMEKTIVQKKDLSLKKFVFLPPWLVLVAMVAASFVNVDAFLTGVNAVTGWILNTFAWLFNLTALACVITVIFVYFSPLGKVRIGGSKAVPMMAFRSLIWITLCTTIAAGILFWGAAEPMYQMYYPSLGEGVEAGSPQAAVFAMKVMFLEWTWTPYAIYTVATLTFTFVFYNMKQRYTLGSVLVPVFGEKVYKISPLIDVLCLFALVAGMSSSLGTGTMTIAGGLENVFGIKSGPVLWGFVITAIVVTFIISSITGIMKGIRILSSINSYVYMMLLVFVLIFGPTIFMLNFTVESLGAYLRDFFSLSLYTGEILKDGWAKGWPIFYWCNWLAWTPITAVFLGRILRGYTIQDAIRVNFVIPSVFSTIWMGLFATASIYFEMNGAGLLTALNERGPEAVVYTIFRQLPLALLVIPFYIFIVFISFVTAADSNTNAMAGLCTHGISQEVQESPSWLKIIWGVTLALVAWIMISFANINGIKAASNLGGFVNLFLAVLMIAGLLKIANNPKKYDVFQEDYDASGKPVKSVRLPAAVE